MTAKDGYLRTTRQTFKFRFWEYWRTARKNMTTRARTGVEFAVMTNDGTKKRLCLLVCSYTSTPSIPPTGALRLPSVCSMLVRISCACKTLSTGTGGEGMDFRYLLVSCLLGTRSCLWGGDLGSKTESDDSCVTTFHQEPYIPSLAYL